MFMSFFANEKIFRHLYLHHMLQTSVVQTYCILLVGTNPCCYADTKGMDNYGIMKIVEWGLAIWLRGYHACNKYYK